MSEFDRAPIIRLQIDQEVFQDAVRDGDEIDDATVATEVTSLERVGDAYVLEGAIVFAGYINRASELGSEPQATAGFVQTQAADSGQSPNGSALHNRLPFVLRVPAKSQPRGLVNVASRISAWQLTSVSPGWIRVVADLSIVGLSGAHGYHFECGSQEDGDVLFGRDDSANSAEVADGHADSQQAATEQPATDDMSPDQQSAQATPELDLQLTRGSRDHDVSPAGGAPQEDDGLAAAETISQARGGAATDNTEPLRSGQQAGDTAQRELASLDKAYGGSVRDEVSSVADERMTKREPDAKSNVVEFDFEHQVSPRELHDAYTPRETAEAAYRGGATEAVGDEPDSAEVEDGGATELSEAEATSLIMRGSPDEENSDGNVISSELWSFVDFNSPEHFYTLRYVIVSEEENLASIADRVGVLKSDLMRANEISEEVVQPGQALAVPGRPVLQLDL
ncbi:LysM peptidoglycan-binding domain-containing protein [Alicyclobacillus sp. ALC3]|uniref:LysM peptidoglycan-binding domain-containing protein n=1 Tax=Alicyclobacillus sp. ALC3 TaxID=2796143 RepID=UPI0023787050|nr:LysM peptidoglycan-binding domain-containing protein [Alicyclobacillus sp. ALC3]WDL96980.1 LysM peptidoglycan-binding domain-containing protein [Alicyclobacillus sp. ALC3]